MFSKRLKSLCEGDQRYFPVGPPSHNRSLDFALEILYRNETFDDNATFHLLRAITHGGGR